MKLVGKHPYVFTTLLATLLSIVVWVVAPREYAAYTKISDEYKEVDLALGLSKLQSRVKERMQLGNTGINDIEVYCKWLKTTEFACHIANVQIPGKGMTYGQWLNDDKAFSLTSNTDTVAKVLEHIEYNISRKRQTLAIQFSDRDPIVASQMLDSVTFHLQEMVTHARRNNAAYTYEEATKLCTTTGDELRLARKRYEDYCDSHLGSNSKEVTITKNAMQKELSHAVNRHQEAQLSCVRQKALMQRSYCSFSVVTNNTAPQSEQKSYLFLIVSIYFLSFVITKAILLYKTCKRDPGFVFDFGNIFSPWVLTAGIWTVVFIGIYIMGDKLYPMTDQAYIGLALWIIPFCLSSFISCQLCGGKSHSAGLVELRYSKPIFYVLLVVTLFMSPMYLKNLMDLINMFGTKDLMSNIRAFAVHGSGFGILDLAFVINKVLFIIALWDNRKGSWKITFLIFILFCMNAFVLMDKGSIFFMLSIYMFVLYERGSIRLYHILMTMAVMLIIFFVLTIMRSGTDSSGNNILDDLTFVEFIGMYMLANPVAFGYLSQSIDPQIGINTFYLLFYYINRFGLGQVEVTEIIQEFVYVPIETNQYTILQPFFVDFGYLGIFVFSTLYGIVSGWTYNRYRRGSSIGKVFYTFFVYILFLQFGQEQVFLLPIQFVRIAFLIYILTQTNFRLTFSKTN